VLRIREDAQVIGRIVEGLTGLNVLAFVFQAPPSTFLNLEQLTVVDRNIVLLIRREPFDLRR
jgi:hypothetical protein